MTMSLFTAPVDITTRNMNNNSDAVSFAPPSKTTDSISKHSGSSCGSASSASTGRQQLRMASEFLFSAAKHETNKVQSNHPTGRDTKGTVDILDAALGVACDGEFDLDDTNSSSSSEDFDIDVKFVSTSPSDDYYGSRTMSRPSKSDSIDTRKKPTTEKREFLLDNLHSFEDMLSKMVIEDDAGDCDTECSEGDYEDGDEESYVSFVEEWDVPVKLPEDPTTTNSYSKLPEGPGKQEKQEIELDNLQSFQAMLDSYECDDESYSSSEEEDEDDFDLSLY